jgi:hypothetical protein
MEAINLFPIPTIKNKDKRWQRKQKNQSLIKYRQKYNKNRQKLIKVHLYFPPQHPTNNQNKNQLR